MAYGATRDAAASAVKALALRVISDRIENGETVPDPLHVSFDAA